MNSLKTTSRLRLLLTISMLGLFCVLILADTPIIRMARISLIEGEVSYRRANQEDSSWFDAATNTPLGENDQVFTGPQGRAEIQLSGRNIVRLNSETSFKVTQFTTAVTQIALPVGDATFRIESLDPRQFDIVDARDAGSNDPIFFEVNTPTVAVTLLKTGTYRISVQEDGRTEIIVHSGEAEVYNQELNNITVRKGNRMVIESQVNGYQVNRIQNKDSFDRWSERRDEELNYQANSVSTQYVPNGIPGVYDLDRYGEWYNTSDYGYVWSPRVVSVGWAPYRAGSWSWYSDWGWTWVSSEPWGWAPYHYGRWAYYRDRWCWVPRSGASVGFSWAPALVTFFGWGNGYNQGYNDGYRQGYRDGRYDYVGWVPLAPGEHYYNPYYRGRGNVTIINNTNIYNARIEGFRNYNVPGGFTRLEGRRFDSHRVVVGNRLDSTPLQQSALKSAITARADSFRPTARFNETHVNPAADPTNRPVTQRQVFTRNSFRNGELVTPRTNVSTQSGVPTLRNNEVPHSSDRNVRPEVRNNNINNGAITTPEVFRNRNGNTESIVNDHRRVERPTERTTETIKTDRPPVTARQPEQPRNSDQTARPSRPWFNSGNNQNDARREANPQNNPNNSPRRVEPERRVEPQRQAEPTREYRREERQAPPRETRSYERPTPSTPPRQAEQRPSPPARVERSEPRTERSSAPRENSSRENSSGRRGHE